MCFYLKDKNFEFIETQFGKGGRIYFPIDKCFYVINGSKKNGVWYFKCSSGKNGCCKFSAIGYDDEKHLTNNILENANHQLGKRMPAHPSVYKFLELMNLFIEGKFQKYVHLEFNGVPDKAISIESQKMMKFRQQLQLEPPSVSVLSVLLLITKNSHDYGDVLGSYRMKQQKKKKADQVKNTVDFEINSSKEENITVGSLDSSY